MTQLLHPPYSPDLAPSYFFLFLRMKKVLKGKRFADVEKVKKKNDGGIKRHHFARVSGLLRKVDRCIASNGQYFERDSICNT